MIVTEKPVKEIIQRSGLPTATYSVNPYVGCPHGCKYCYASSMVPYSAHTESWGAFVDVKLWEKQITPEVYNGAGIVIGSATDPYNPMERKYLVTQKLLQQLLGTTAEITVITKSDLVLRDIEFLRQFTSLAVAVSLNTLDDEFRADMDKAASVEQRLNTMQKLHLAGIKTVCFIAPIFPGVTDVPEIVFEVLDYCDEIWVENLNLRGKYRSTILKYIMEKYPEWMPTYDRIYGQRNYTYWHRLESQIEGLCKDMQLTYIKNNQVLGPVYDNRPVVRNYFYHSHK